MLHKDKFTGEHGVTTIDVVEPLFRDSRSTRIIEPKRPIVDRNVFQIATLANQDEADRAFWLTKSARERLLAVEQIRQVLYAYNPSSQRLQRVVEVVEVVEQISR